MRWPWSQKKEIQPQEPEPRWKREVREWSKSLFVGLLFVFFFTEVFFKAYKVDGVSMEPLMRDGERLFVNRIAYHTDPIPFINWRIPWTHPPERDDVVVFWFPRNPEQYFIKRIIGIPGDRIEIKKGTIWVNGIPREDGFVPLRFRDRRTHPATTVPVGYYYMVGDHRNRSFDSRDWGFVPRKYVIGKAVLRYWPLNKLGLVRTRVDS